MEALCVCACSLPLHWSWILIAFPSGFFFQGFRSLEDIRNQASLTTQQAIGLKHYDDFLDRMPREEAAEIEQTVSRCPRPVRRARSYYNSGPGSKPRTRDPSAGEPSRQRKLWGPEIGTSGERAIGLGREGLQH